MVFVHVLEMLGAVFMALSAVVVTAVLGWIFLKAKLR